MATQDVLIGIDFGGGIDQSVDPKRVFPTNMLELSNVRLVKRKQVSKRLGFSRQKGMDIAGFGSRYTGSYLHSLGGTPILCQDSRFLQPEIYGDRWAPSSDIVAQPAADFGINLPSVVIDAPEIQTVVSAGDVTLCDSATIGEYICRCWQDGTTSVFQLVSAATGAQIIPQTSYITAQRPRVLSTGTTFLLGFVNTATNNLEFRTITPGTSTTFPGAATSTLTLVSTTQRVWDWVWYSTNAVVAYNSSTATTIRLASINSAAVTSGATSFAVGGTIDALCVCDRPIPSGSGTDDVLIVYHDTTQGLRVRYFNANPLAAGTSYGGANHLLNASVTGVENIAATHSFNNNQEFRVLVQYTAAATYNRLVTCYQFADGAPPTGVGAPFNQRGVGLASRFLVRSGRAFSLVVFDTLTQKQYLLIEWNPSAATEPAIHGRFLFGEAGGLTTAPHLARISELDTGIATENRFTVAVLRVTRVFTQGSSFSQIRTYSEAVIDFGPFVGTRQVETADSALVAGGFIGLIDGGNGASEHGFFMGPENLSTTVTLAGGSLADGTYQQLAYYEWYDSKGRVHRSACSPVVTSVVSGGGGAARINLTIPTCRLTMRTNAVGGNARTETVRIVVCRTEANGKIFFRSSSTPSSIANTVAADTVLFLDTISNATLIANEASYHQPTTEGGEVNNFTPDGGRAICKSPERVFVAVGSDIYYSKPIVDGVAVSFAQEFVISLPSEGGPITALEYQEGKIYAFKRQQIWSFGGDGPSSTGAGGAFSVPERLPHNGGCLGQFACVSTPIGIMTVTPGGVYLLTRAEAWVFVGDKIRDENPFAIVSAHHVSKASEVRFIAGATTLVYNYEFTDEEGVGAWSKTTFSAKDARTVDRGFVPALNKQIGERVYSVAGSSGELYFEPDGVDAVFTDEGIGDYQMAIGIGWVTAPTVQGWWHVKRIFLLGQYKSTTTLKVEIAYDYEDIAAADADAYFISTLTAAPNSSGVMQLEIQPRRQKCEAFRVRITNTSSGEVCNLTALSALVGVQPGAMRLPITRRAA